MKQISSRLAPIYKTLFPLVTFIVTVLTSIELARYLEIAFIHVMVIALLIMGLMYLWLRKAHNFDYVDEAYDQGTQLYFENGDKSATVPFTDIEKIEYGHHINKTIVIVYVKIDTPLGRKIKFLPPWKHLTLWEDLLNYNYQKYLDDLLDRIDKAKGL